MVLATWNPVREFERMRAIADEMLADHPAMTGTYERGRVRSFPVSITEAEDEVTVRAALPGFASEDIEMSYEQGQLMIKAHHKPQEDEQHRVLYDELWEGDLYRGLSLPQSLDFDNAHATLDLGMLTLRIPKKEEAKPKRIPVSTPIASLN